MVSMRTSQTPVRHLTLGTDVPRARGGLGTRPSWFVCSVRGTNNLLATDRLQQIKLFIVWIGGGFTVNPLFTAFR